MAVTGQPAHRDFGGNRGLGARVIRILLTLLSLLILVNRATAAERWEGLAGIIFQNYGREQGLPPLVPTTLAQDGDGLIWIGTQGGLVRWDGYHFREYDAAAGGPGALPGGWIHVLHTDASGQLWVGTDADGLARYNRDQDSFTIVPVGPAGPGRHHIGALCDDNAGGLWVGTDLGLYHLGAGKAADPVLRSDEGDPRSLPGDKVQAVLLDRAGRLWVGTDQGLARQDPGAKGFARVSLPDATGSNAAGGAIEVSTLFEDPQGRIWIGTTQHGLYLIGRGRLDARRFGEPDWVGGTLRTAWVSAITPVGENELWVSTRASGIVDIDLLKDRAKAIRHDKLVSSSLGHDDVWAMLRDRAGSLWVGGAGGLSYHPRDTGTVRTVFGDTMQPNGITDPDISAVLSTRDGRIWLGFLTGGADILDPIAGRVAQMRPDPKHPDTALPRDVVSEMAEAANGDVYVGTFRGVYRADRRGHDVVLTRSAGRDPHAPVRALLIDGPTLWIGGRDGLWRTPIGPGAPPALGPAAFGRLSDPGIFALLRGAGRDLWIGTLNGLNRLDLASGAIENILAEPANPAALPARLVSTLVYDWQGRLWVGTFGGGVAVMVGRDPAGRPVFHRISVAEGLPDRNVDRLLVDGSGMVWASTDDGLAVIDPTSFKVRAIKSANGAPLSVYWVKAGAVDLWGEPLFGAKGGLTVVRPGWPSSWSQPAPVVVTDIRIGGKSVPGGRFNGAGGAGPLVLTAQTNSLTVEFAALDFTAPERNRYAYRLEGFDRDWIDSDPTRRLAAYTNLPPGDYVLKLRGSNRDGVWTEPAVRIPIHVLAAWYQSLWVSLAQALAVAAALLGVMAAVIRRRTASIRRRQTELEQEIAKRTADLRAANARLSALATIDPLTGCANRRHFMERAHALVQLGRRGVPMSLAIMDLDNFKRINDSHGHPVGDEVLRMTGALARDQIRATDVVGRIGGEEFAVLMPNSRAGAAHVVIERLRAALADSEVRIGDTGIRVTASLGLAQQREGEDFDGLYARADAALYAAKAAGRNRVVVAADEDPPAGP